jgi:hypothetical protein
MKKLTLLLFTVLFVSCDKQDTNTPVNVDKGTKLTVSPTLTSIDDNSGTVYINVKSDTEWTVTINNLGTAGIKDIDVSPMSGSKDANIKVKYGKRANILSNTKESISIVIFYYNYGYRQGVTSTIKRK